MRNLLFGFLLLAGTSLSAQTKEFFPVKGGMFQDRPAFLQERLFVPENRLVTSQRVDQIKALSADDLLKSPIRKAESATQYIARTYAAGGSYAPMYYQPTLAISGNDVTISLLFPYRNFSDVTGTLNGSILTVTKEQKVMDLQLTDGTPVDGLIGELNLENGSASDIKFTVENGRYVYTPTTENHAICIFAYSGNGIALLEYFDMLVISEFENMEPLYAAYTPIWSYGQSLEGYNVIGYPSVALSSSELGFVSVASGVASVVDGYSYVANWSYMADGTETAAATEADGSLLIPVSSGVSYYSYPTVSVTSGSYTNTYGEERAIYVNLSSVVEYSSGERLDHGFSMASNTADIFGRSNNFLYGKGTVYNNSQKVDIVGVASVYQAVTPLTFSSASMVIYVPSESALFGKEVQLQIHNASVTNGQLSIDEDPIAFSRIMIGSDNYHQWAASSENSDLSMGMLEFADFYGDDEGFEVRLDQVTTGQYFIAMLYGLDEANFGIYAEGTPDFAGYFLGLPETAYVIASDGYMYSQGTYSDLCINFYGATLSSPTSISEVAQGRTDVTAFINGTDFQLSYPEGTASVQILNVAGQTVGSYDLEGTSAAIPAAGLAKGLYLLKFDNGTTVKVMR